MKKKQVVAVVGMLMALGVFAETWTDSKTGLTWTYQVVGDGVSVGGDDSTTALPASTSGAIEIPSVINGIKVTCIGNSAFRSCSLLNEIVIPDGVEIVGDSAFQYCESLESMAFPVGVRSIGRWTFSGCNALSSVNIPESVTNIGYLAFGSCTSLVSLTVSEANAHYRSIENVMFSKDMKTLVACAGGKSGDYEIPCGVEEIGVWAFEGCRKISSLTLPLSVTQIGWRAVNNLGNLVSFAVDTANSFYKAVNGLLLTKDGTVLLAGVNGDVSIPDGVVYIDGQAFYGCRGLVGITIPPSVKSIGYRAFDGCSGLVALTIPSTVTEMDAYAFNGCSGLKSVAISDGLTYIPDFAFSGCEVLKSVTIPLKVESVGNYAFFGCKGLASISIPSCVTSVGNCAFSGCAELESIAFPYGLTSVGAEAFYDCSSLTSVTLPSSVENIGRYAFSNCRGLTSMSLPPGIESIEYGLFNNCSGLTTVTIPSNVVKIEDWAFGGCSALQRMTIPSSVSQIGYEAFYECENLNAIDFEWEPPEGLASAGIAADAAIRYHAECEDEWLPVIEECGFTNATAYEPDPKPVTFVAVNGEVSRAALFYTSDVYGVLPEARRDGFAFAGWYTSLDGTNRVSAFSAVDPKVKTLYARWVEDDVSLFAQWEANRYSVNFNANGGEGEMETQPFLYDQVQGLTGAGFTKTGYSFKGWSTSADGKVVYKDGEIVSNLTAEAGFAVALFAQWEKVIDVPAADIEEWVYDIASTFKKQGETSLGYCKRFAAKYGDDYSAAFFKETGKIGQDGARLQVWHDYVAGTDPLDENDTFTATITIEDGVVKVDCRPKFADAVEADRRLYKTWGKVTLGDTDWVEVTSGHEGDYNFFKVTVEMK